MKIILAIGQKLDLKNMLKSYKLIKQCKKRKIKLSQLFLFKI